MFRMFFPPLEEATLKVTSGASFEAFLLFGSSGSLARSMQNVIFLFFSSIFFQIALLLVTPPVKLPPEVNVIDENHSWNS